MSHPESSTVTVEATFHDHVAAEIASALLTDASVLADERHAIDIKWRIRVGELTPTMARRAEAILRTARAIDVQMVVSKPNERHARGDLKFAV